MRKLTQEQFIEKAIAIHGQVFIYDKLVYNNMREPVVITCKLHGDFIQSPSSHLQGTGCPRCGGTGRYSTEEFIEKAISIHGDKYLYDKTVYTKSQLLVQIRCRKHGIFSQTPNSHLTGSGCPYCAREANDITSRFASDEPAQVYLIQIGNNYKIGVTKHTIEHRYRKESISFTKIGSWHTTSNLCYLIEKLVLCELSEHRYKGPDILELGGNSEILTINPNSVIEKHFKLQNKELNNG